MLTTTALPDQPRFPTYVERGRASSAFADGHVDTIPPKYTLLVENYDPTR